MYKSKIIINLESDLININRWALILTIALLIHFVCQTIQNIDRLDTLYNSTFWASLAVTWCLIFISGQMWNYINGSPFVYIEDNQYIYVDPSMSTQLTAESYLIMFSYLGVTLGIILLVESASNTEHKPQSKQFMTVLGLVIIGIFFSLVLSTFKTKIPSYPL